MQAILLFIHVMVSLALIGLVLIQHGKGADMGASFGAGASQTLFGSQGSGSFLVKVTAILAFVFFATTLLLGYVGARQAREQGMVNLPTSLLKQAESAGNKVPPVTVPPVTLPNKTLPPASSTGSSSKTHN